MSDDISRIPKERLLTLKKTKKGWTIESKKEVTPEAKEARCEDLRWIAHYARCHFFFGVVFSDINVGQS